MFGTEAKLIDTHKTVVASVKSDAFKSIRHALFSIRKTAIGSMVRAKGPSPAGQPPHRHRGRLARSILVATEGDDGGIVGPSYAAMQSGGMPPWMARIHEQGGTLASRAKTKSGKLRKAVVYPARPFMAPALEQVSARFSREWKGGSS